jgi:hypothetical protein
MLGRAKKKRKSDRDEHLDDLCGTLRIASCDPSECCPRGSLFASLLLPKKARSREIVQDAVIVDKADVSDCTVMPWPAGSRNSKVFNKIWTSNTMMK